MSNCPSCGRAVEEGADACGSCGVLLGATLASEAPLSSSSAANRPAARFEAGRMLGGRYRIVGLLGRGGMGEVYRADDLELGQPVALKFLPEELVADTAALDRFRAEVRTARQVAHPNVCRTYDIGNVDGHVFISMEFVDGEDLATALRRMGRPSADKAYEIARQLCLGLVAAHENGVLHRDLKPANVMIDGRGRVRITDFGLAGLIEEFDQDSSRAGTPAYMAPEQLDKGTVSVRSDIYALGLVLHELFTGKRLFDATTPAELREQQATSSLTASSASSNIDPAVERLVGQCLERDPQRRPPSVYAVLGALPGGDPIAAALAAGETPSPDLVAAAGEAGGLAPRVALACLAGALITLGIMAFAPAGERLHSLLPLPMSPDELEFRALDLLEDLGHERRHEASARGLALVPSYQDYVSAIEEADASPERWSRLAQERPAAASFWLRFADSTMDPAGAHSTAVRRDNPPLAESGSGRIELDPSGRLLALAVVPRSETDASPEPPSVAPLFEKAGLSFEAFAPTTLRKSPPVFCEAMAFEGPSESDLAERLIVQVGTHGGKAVYFELLWPWNLADAQPSGVAPDMITAGIMVTLFFALVALATRNLSVGRCDRVGAFRLAAFVVACFLLQALLTDLNPLEAPVETLGSLLNGKALAHALLHALIAWLAYVALEPHARRQWPRTLVTWTRVLRGNVRDAQVGRDVLLGALAAGLVGLLANVGWRLAAWSGGPPPGPIGQLEAWDVSRAAGNLVGQSSFALMAPMVGLSLLVILRMVVRNARLAVCLAVGLAFGFALIGMLQAPGQEDARLVQLVVPCLAISLLAALLLRFGLLATVASAFFLSILGTSPMTLDFTRWYAPPTLVPLTAVVLLLLWAFKTSLGGRTLLQDEFAEG